MDSAPVSALAVSPTDTQDATTTCRLEDELDAAWLAQVEALVLRLVTCGQPVTLDLADITFIDCAGLGGLIEIVDIARQCGVEVTLGRCSKPVDRLLDLTGCRTWLSKSIHGSLP